jgi:hypothetical protein
MAKAERRSNPRTFGLRARCANRCAITLAGYSQRTDGSANNTSKRVASARRSEEGQPKLTAPRELLGGPHPSADRALRYFGGLKRSGAFDAAWPPDTATASAGRRTARAPRRQTNRERVGTASAQSGLKLHSASCVGSNPLPRCVHGEICVAAQARKEFRACLPRDSLAE